MENARIWTALAGPREKPVAYVALFNLDSNAAKLHATWKQLGLHGHAVHDLWTGKARAAANGITVSLPAHGSAIYRVE